MPYVERWRIIITSSFPASSPNFYGVQLGSWLATRENPSVFCGILGFSITKWGNPSWFFGWRVPLFVGSY
jgi:hypothetical protein